MILNLEENVALKNILNDSNGGNECIALWKMITHTAHYSSCLLAFNCVHNIN